MLRDMVTGLPEFNMEHNDVCRGCGLGKYTETALSSSDSRLAGVLDLIHFDLCGPMSSVSLRGFEYYATFIDDYSRKTYIYFLRRSCRGSKNSKLLWRTKLGGGFKHSDQITGVSIPPRSLMCIVDRKKYRDS